MQGRRCIWPDGTNSCEKNSGLSAQHALDRPVQVLTVLFAFCTVGDDGFERVHTAGDDLQLRGYAGGGRRHAGSSAATGAADCAQGGVTARCAGTENASICQSELTLSRRQWGAERPPGSGNRTICLAGNVSDHSTSVTMTGLGGHDAGIAGHDHRNMHTFRPSVSTQNRLSVA